MYCKSSRLFNREIMPNSVTMYTKNSTFYVKEYITSYFSLPFFFILQYNCTMNMNEKYYQICQKSSYFPLCYVVMLIYLPPL